jgi:putative ABC transport system ATP-binding protein
MKGILCRNVTKYFDGDPPVHVLRGVDLEVPEGKLCILAGPSGCGKTTLISIVSGVLSGSGGEVNINGTLVTSLTKRENVQFRLYHLGFIFQQYHLIPALTLLENVSIPLVIQGVGRKEAHDRSRTLLEELGLSGMEDRFPSQVSGGQQQRIAIARALVHQPSVIICDEPTAALDEKTGIKVMSLLSKAARERGCTVIIVTHDHRIFSFADQIAYMNDGLITQVEKALT